MPAPGTGRGRGRGERWIGIPRRIPFSQCHFDRTVSGTASSFDESTASRRHFADLRNRDDPSFDSCESSRWFENPIAKEAEEAEEGPQSGSRINEFTS